MAINFAKFWRRLMGVLGVGKRPTPPPPPVVLEGPVDPPAPTPDPPPPPPPVPTTGLKGQFVIRTKNPFAGTSEFPAAKEGRFFLAELDTLWDRLPEEALRILDEYQALGANHIMGGPAWAHGYSGHYPDTNWLSRPEKLAAYLALLRNRGIAVSFVVGPDNAPYYNDRTLTFDWDKMAELGAWYDALQTTHGVVFDRVVSQWEQYQSRAEARRLFQWMKQHFPNAKRFWHNPPGHLSPGTGDEEEAATWKSAREAGIHGLYLQAIPDDDDRAPGERPAFDQMKYDLWDMVRRFKGPASPWGEPISGLTVTFTEGTAHPMYWRGDDQSLARKWAQGALSVEGVEPDSLDGLP